MNNREALIAEISVFTPGNLSVEKALIDNNLDPNEQYGDSKAVAKAAIQVLEGLIFLTSEKEGSFSQSYDPAQVKAMICSIASKHNFQDVLSKFDGTPVIVDGSSRW